MKTKTRLLAAVMAIIMTVLVIPLGAITVSAVEGTPINTAADFAEMEANGTYAPVEPGTPTPAPMPGVNDSAYPFTVDGEIICSTNKAHNSSSIYTYTVYIGGTYDLKYKVSSETNYDYLTIKHNGTQIARISGSVSWTTRSITVAAGDVITVTYSKDGSTNVGSDCGWVDFSDFDTCAHVYNGGTVVPPTCVAQGYTVYTCTLCGNTYNDLYTNIIAHQYSGGYCTGCGRSESTPECDIVFLIDITGSMSGEIANVKNSIIAFSEQLEGHGIDAQLALVTYADITTSEDTKIFMNGDSPWWTDAEEFRDIIGTISLGNGGDTPETTVDGLEASRRLTWRDGASKFIVVVTDATYKVDNSYDISSMEEMIMLLQDDGIITSVATTSSCYSTYQGLVDSTQGVMMNINNNFGDEMVELVDTIHLTTRITRITVKKYPNRTTYYVGEYLDPTGLVITVHYSDGTSVDLTTGFDCYPNTQLTLGDTIIRIVYNGFHETIPLTVTESIVNVTGMSIDKNELFLSVGEKDTIIATVEPAGATNKNITWYSSNDRVATVVDGKVVAVGEGTAVITAIAVDGSYTATCSVTIVPHSHNFTEASRTPATCAGYGEIIYTCTCGASYNELLESVGHDYRITSTVEATCTADGHIEFTCQAVGCGATKRQTLPMLGHDYGSDNVCDRCGHTIVIHDHGYTSVTVVPTCTDMGYTEYTCSCGHSYRDNYVEPTRHNWNDGAITTEKTCISDGIKTYTCQDCTATKTEILAAGHEWSEVVTVDKTCTTDGSMVKSCTVCGETETEVIPAGHNWDAGVETLPAYCETEGSKDCTCLDCGAPGTFVIPKLGHSFVNGICTRCGVKFIDVVTDSTHPLSGMYFEIDDILSDYGPSLIDEYGVLLDYNSDATLEKVAVYLTQDGTMWRRCIAVVGEGITYATYVPYLSYQSDIKYTGLNHDWINIFRLNENSDGIWCYSNYATIGANLQDAYGNLLLSLYDIGQAGAQTRIFDDLDEMIAWLKGGEPDNRHTVTFVNYDGEPLYTTEVADGETAVYGGSTPIKPDDVGAYYVFAGWSISLENVSGDMTVTAVYTRIPYGDTDNDGVVSQKDVTALRRYLAGWDIEIIMEASDVDGDGEIGQKDVTRLRRYLAGWDVTLGGNE